MYRKCATELSAQHQRQITESLLVLMQRMPYDDITVTALCEASGITRRIFYHLFYNKTGALHALIDHTILGAESYRPDMPQSLRIFLYWKEQKPLLDALRENKMDSLLLERMIECVTNEDYEVRHWLRAGDWKQKQDILIFYLTGFMGIVYRWSHDGFRESPEEMADLWKTIISTPLSENRSHP